jgi:hypothetical protein
MATLSALAAIFAGLRETLLCVFKLLFQPLSELYLTAWSLATSVCCLPAALSVFTLPSAQPALKTQAAKVGS